MRGLLARKPCSGPSLDEVHAAISERHKGSGGDAIQALRRLRKMCGRCILQKEAHVWCSNVSLPSFQASKKCTIVPQVNKRRESFTRMASWLPS